MDVLKFLNGLKNGIAILIDPDKFSSKDELRIYLDKVSFANPDIVFIGGSTVSKIDFQNCVELSKEKIKAPIVIFPGASHQLSEHADAILFLSLISGRNPDYLIGHHIAAVSELEKMNLQIIPTSYMLVDGGKKSSVEYISNTNPIPKDAFSIARKTALAGKYLGHKILYADAGSGAMENISKEMITILSETNSPLIVGGGIRSIEQIRSAHQAGAQVVVIGNKVEEDINFLLDIKNYSLNLGL
ncbi:phosphoglycerol geranylgeranyltransferase [Crocinitomicaceae bacterium]|nr:phosphoglycerol geranylgeranyltransferase [Crocinitomicaceae bacterium]